MNPWPILADLSEADRSQLIFWLVILLIVVVLGFGAILIFRRHLKEPAGGPSRNPGFSLSQLREMRDRGEITPEEYEHTKARVVAKIKGTPMPPNPGEGTSPPPPPLPPEAPTDEG